MKWFCGCKDVVGHIEKIRTLKKLNQNITKQALTYGLILMAGIITFFVNSFSHPAIILLLPGLLFGLALTIPHFDKSRKQIIAITTLPIFMILLWILSVAVGLGFGIINNSYTDKTGVIILGIISSLLFAVIIDQYYPIVNKKTSYIIIIILGITSTLICDYLFLTPHSKELNFGKMIFIWELLIGLGLTIFTKFEWMTNQNKLTE
jgi:hypothetical protein